MKISEGFVFIADALKASHDVLIQEGILFSAAYGVATLMQSALEYQPTEFSTSLCSNVDLYLNKKV